MDSKLIKGRYELRRVIQKGPMATTHEAWDVEETRPVILKEVSIVDLPEGSGFKPAELLEREGRILKNLDHPGIPRFIDAFEECKGTRFWLVQEFRSGKNLKQLVEEGWHGDVAEIVRILEEVARIVTFLHDRVPPLIHRDIKPANIVLSDSGEVSVVDLGAVCTRVLQKNAGSTIVGTPGYVPLEQFAGRAVRASDVYALGMVAIYLLTHTEPSLLLNPDGRVHYKHLTELEHPTLLPTIDAMIEPRASDRLQNMKAVLEALQGKAIAKSPKSPKRPRYTAPLLAAGLSIALIAGLSALYKKSHDPGPPPPEAVQLLQMHPVERPVEAVVPPAPPAPEVPEECTVRTRNGKTTKAQCEHLESQVTPIVVGPGRIRLLTQEPPEELGEEEYDEYSPYFIVDLTPKGHRTVGKLDCPKRAVPVSATLGPRGSYHVLCYSEEETIQVQRIVWNPKTRAAQPVGTPQELLDLPYPEESIVVFGQMMLPALMVPKRGPAVLLFQSENEELGIPGPVKLQPLAPSFESVSVSSPGSELSKGGEPIVLYQHQNRVHALYGRLSQTPSGLKEEFIPVAFSSHGGTALSALSSTLKTPSPSGCRDAGVFQTKGALHLRIPNEFGDAMHAIELKGAHPIGGPTTESPEVMSCTNPGGIIVSVKNKTYTIEINETPFPGFARATCVKERCLAVTSGEELEMGTFIAVRFEQR